MATITDREAYLALINALQTARESCRALGLNRGDMRWIKVAGMMDQCKDNVTKLFDRAQGNRGVIN